MNFAEALRDLKLRRHWSDERLAHELRHAGIDVSLDAVKSWVYGRRTPAERVRAALDRFLKEANMALATTVTQRVKLGCKVSSKVLAHAATRPDQRQIAVSLPLGGAANQDRYVEVRLVEDDAAATLLIAGDTHAIWRQHVPQESLELFDRLYSLLSLFPDSFMWIEVEVEIETED